ncbi:MAG: hypothetical protein ACI4TH_05630 [Candidatus Ornithomonoglobus sp.]
MFKKMFGGTETQQLKYLQIRVIITAITLGLMLIGGLLYLLGLDTVGSGIASAGGGAFAIVTLVWAWSFLRAWFGWASFGALFTGNIIFGVVIMVLYLFIGYLLGLIAFLIGTGRYIYLMVKKHQTGLVD